MRKGIGVSIGIALMVAIAWGLWSLSQPKRESNEVGPREPPTVEAPGVRQSAQTSAEVPEPPRTKARRAKRDAMREQILEARRARTSPANSPSAGLDGGSREPAVPPQSGDERGNASPGLQDRTGNHGYLMKVMNEDLMPLMDECIEMAREREAELSGMLIIDLEILGDEEIGGVVETVGPGSNNEVADPELLECVTESILSTTLPPPPEGGRDPISISMPVTSDE